MDSKASSQDDGQASTPEEGLEQVLGNEIEMGQLMVQWIHGAANCNQDQNPPIQIHQYSKSVYILRQNKCLNFEGPFMYLILGENKALLLDSGATRSAAQFPIRDTVENILSEHYPERNNIELVVAHSHAHGDHIQGDGQFQGQAKHYCCWNQPSGSR